MNSRWFRPVGMAGGLIVLLVANYYLRHTLEDAPRYLTSFLETFYQKEIPILFGELPRWRLFLPLEQLTGAWVTTTLIATYLVEQWVGPAGAWYLFNAAAIVVAFATSLVVFRSAVFSFTFSICVGFGTQFYHAYAVPGGIASYLFITYHMLLLAAAVQFVRGARPRWAWGLALAVSLALNVLGYEGWLDLLVLFWVAAPLLYLGLRRMEAPAEAGRVAWLTAALTVVGVAYITVKVTYGFGQTQGSESDVLFNYRSLWPIIDDLVSNAFTHAYMSVSNFLPPSLVGASAFYRLGPEYLLTSQHGYHEPFNYLVPMQQVFFWRYYAGATFVLMLVAMWLTVKRAWRRPSAWTLALGVFLLMMLVAGPTHSLIKFRPMNAAPVMTYHVTVGVLGASLLISWLVTSAWRTWRPRNALVLLIVVWSAIFYSALARPPYLSHMAAQVGLGEFLYPNPMKVLVQSMGGTYEAPRGLALFRLMQYRADDSLALARAALADLPAPLPPAALWEPGVAEWLTRIEGGGIEVAGDSTQFGYQVMSPIVPVTPNTSYLLRLRFETVDGRVCAGVLSGNQQRWLVAPDGTSVEYAFNSGDLDGIRVVIANCYGYDAGNPRTRFKLMGGSFGIVSAPQVPK